MFNMAASGKKKGKGKVKGKTVNLNDFLSAGESSAAPGTSFVYSSKSSWADESADNDNDFSSGNPWDARSSQPIALPTAPKSASGILIDKSMLPDKPPYTIYLGNLPFDCSTDDIKEFLSQEDCNVSDVRLPMDGDTQRPKGFGYAEIDDMESLYKALSLSDKQLRSRRIRVDLASQAQTDGKGGGGFDKTAGDWRKSDRSGDSSWNQAGTGGDRYGGSSNRESKSDGDSMWRDRGGSSNADSFGGRDRGGFGGGGGRDGDRGGFGRDRGGGGFERNYDQSGGGGSDSRGFGQTWERGGDRGGDRGGGFSDRGGYERRGPDRGFERGGGGFDRNDRGGGGGFDRGPDRGFDRGSAGGYERAPDRGFERGPRRDESDEGRDAWRRSDDAGPRRGDAGPPDTGEAPRERKRLVLTKRTQPIEQKPAPATAAASSSSIFGAAKPVDTAAKEREIAERLERERREEEERKQPQLPDREPLRKEGSQEHPPPRVRRDSERSEGREGRTRHSSSGSGRGGPRPVIMRRESERSTGEEDVFHKDDQAPVSPTPTSPPPPKTPTSPRQDENVKLIPAPPPKENAWAKRSETVGPPSGGAPTSSPRSSQSHEPAARRDSGSDRPRGGGVGGAAPRGGGGAWSRGQGQRPDGGGRGGGPPNRGGRAPPRGDDGGRGRPPPQQGAPAALPKYEEPKSKDWSDSNKFSTLLEDELGNLSD